MIPIARFTHKEILSNIRESMQEGSPRCVISKSVCSRDTLISLRRDGYMAESTEWTIVVHASSEDLLLQAHAAYDKLADAMRTRGVLRDWPGLLALIHVEKKRRTQ